MISADKVWFIIDDAKYKLSEWVGGMVPFGTAANKFLYTTAAKVWAEADISSFGRTFVNYANAATAFGNIKQAATTSATGVTELATDAEVRSAATGDKVLTSAQLETAAAFVPLTDAATVTFDWDAGINFELELTTDRVLGNPSNGQVGTWRTVLVSSDGGADTLTFDTNYGGELPELTDVTTTKWYLLMVFCVTTSHFLVFASDASPP